MHSWHIHSRLLCILLVALIVLMISCSGGINGKWIAVKEISGGEEYVLSDVVTYLTIKKDQTILYEHYKDGQKKPYNTIKYHFALKPESATIELYPLKDETKGGSPDNVEDRYYERRFEKTNDGYLIHQVAMRVFKFKKIGVF